MKEPQNQKGSGNRNHELIDKILRDSEMTHDQKVAELSRLKGRAYFEGRDDAAPASKSDLRRIEDMLKDYGISKPGRDGSQPEKVRETTQDR